MIRSDATGSTAPSAWAQAATYLTEGAARACYPWVGAGDKEAADAAAVEALRRRAENVDVRASVVIGEGEEDDAPYLAPGQPLGAVGSEPAANDETPDVAVDPLEGTELVAHDLPGALSVLALAPAGTLRPFGRAFYAEKLMGPPAATDILDLDAHPSAVIEKVADVLNTTASDIRVAVQKRPRHTALVEALRAAGTQVRLFKEGDLSFALQALQPRPAPQSGDDDRPQNDRRQASSEDVGATNASTNARHQQSDSQLDSRPVDLLWGIGGAPEGMLAAAAQRAIGGSLQLRFAPRSEAERRRLFNDPALPNPLERMFDARELVQTDTVAMALTGVTDGPLLAGLHQDGGLLRTETLLLTSEQGARRQPVTLEMTT